MRTPAILLATTAAFFPTFAFQLPFNINLKLPFFATTQQKTLPPSSEAPETNVPNRIAIIGAGAGGSSAAFWIGKAKERYGLAVEVDVYDKNSYIGGRSTTVHAYDDDTLEPHELGASIFVDVNKNLWRAVDEFGLERTSANGGDNDEQETMGIWDGYEFVLTTGGGSLFSGWLDKIKILWRYGYKAPTKTEALVKAMTDKFVTFYAPEPPQWQNISSIASQMDWSDVVAQTASEYLDLQGIDRRWTRELVEAATRVNYGQNVDKIHALEGMCSLAAGNAATVKGGNWQIFEHFVTSSNASVFLNTTVKSVTRYSPTGPWVVQSTSSTKPRLYRSVILAAPYHQTGIAFSTKTPFATVPQQPYVRLHVTLLTTTAAGPNPSYFGFASNAKVPTTILTTYDGVRQRNASEPEFNSLTYHGAVRSKNKNANVRTEKERFVKIFSKERIEDKWLEEMFQGQVGWVHRKEWDAYPVLPPTTEFPPVKLADGLYYVNAFEPLISTMETETIAARNVVELLMKEQFDAGICKPGVREGKMGDDFVYGWDC